MPVRHGMRPSGIMIVSAVSITTFSLVVCLACREERRPHRPPQTASAPAVRTATGGQAGQQAVAPATQPEGPPYLPANLPTEGWTRREPVYVGSAEELSKLLPASQALWLDHFHVRSAASSAYMWEGGGRNVIARAVVLEAESPEDAYGLTTCQSSSPEIIDMGGETRVDSGIELRFHCWQGSAYVQVWTDQTDEKAALQTRRLLMHIVGRIPRADLPGLVEAMPRESARPGQRWLVRHVAGLSAATFGLQAGFDLEEVGKLLGLSGETLMCVGSYDVPQAHQPNVVWVVRYPSEKAAGEAFERYMRRLEGTSEPVWRSTSLLPPRGRFLVGTWTAEEESMQYLLPRIEQLLPF